MHSIKYINFSRIDIMECKSIMYNTFCSPALTVEMEGTILVTATLKSQITILTQVKSKFYIRFPSTSVVFHISSKNKYGRSNG